MDPLELLEEVGIPVPRKVWSELIGDEAAAALDESFVAFMKLKGGHAIFEVQALAAGAGLERFLGGEDEGWGSVRFEHFLLDKDLRHFLPFAINEYGGRFLIRSGDCSVWYANLDGHEDAVGGMIADTFDAFLSTITGEENP